jgi:hypothetical protein
VIADRRGTSVAFLAVLPPAWAAHPADGSRQFALVSRFEVLDVPGVLAPPAIWPSRVHRSMIQRARPQCAGCHCHDYHETAQAMERA